MNLPERSRHGPGITGTAEMDDRRARTRKIARPRLRGRDPALQSSLWLPSQNGLWPEYLQPQRATLLGWSSLNWTGWNPVPLWLPSQKGWLPERPQAHQ